MTTEFFVDSNELKSREVISPSGRHKLLIRYYSTKENSWHYSRGTVTRISDNSQVCDIQRNYSTFHHSFVTKDNQEWLITGRSYMSQTIINLDTGQEYQLPGDQKNGSAFCWAGATLSPDGNILVVNGCYWACSYELKFFDFTDPSKGWPELEIEPDDLYIKDDAKAPVFNSDGGIVCFETNRFYIPLQQLEDDVDLNSITDEDYENEANWKLIEYKINTLQKQGSKMKLISQWESEAYQEQKRKNNEASEAFSRWLKDFRANDPIFLCYSSLLKKYDFVGASNYETHGITYKGWCPDFHLKETKWSRRIMYRGGSSKSYTVDLEWGVETGPIKLQIFKDGDTFEDKFFPHSVEGMEQAFEYAKQL